MKVHVRRILFFLVASLVSIYQPTVVLSCGPFFTQIIFESWETPGAPVQMYLDGRLGIVLPSFQPRYLRLAYAYLAGKRLDRKMRDSLMTDQVSPRITSEQGALEQWNSARALVPGRAAQPSTEQYTSELLEGRRYVAYLNITDDALITASRTLRDLVQQFGAEHPAVVDWLRAQDQVFSTTIKKGEPPQLCNPDFPYIFQAHRFYQIAAANFYLGNFDLAARMFGDLATDTLSPWHEICNYLVARALVRKATIETDDARGDSTTLELARVHLIRLLEDGRFMSIHPPSKSLLHLIQLRIRPQERISELERTFRSLSPSELLQVYRGSRDWEDYESVAYQFTNAQKLQEASFRRTIYEEERRIAARSDDSDWIFSFSGTDSISFIHSIGKWNENRSSLPWFLSVLSKTSSRHPMAREVLSFGRTIRRSSPAYVSIRYHMARLHLEFGERDAARMILDSILPQAWNAMPHNSYNRLMLMRLRLASDPVDYIKHAQLGAAEVQDTDEKSAQYYESFRYFGHEAIELNFAVPLTVVKKILDARVLDRRLQQELAVSAWTRAVLLVNDSMAIALSKLAEEFMPTLRTQMIAYRSEPDSASRRFSAALIMARNPGCDPFISSGQGRSPSLHVLDNYGNNWWGALDCYAAEPYRRLHSSFSPHASSNSIGDILSEKEKEMATAEYRALSNGPAPYVFFCEEAIRWARTHQDDARSPEALHLAIRAGRYGAVRSNESQYCREAFFLLHRMFPKSVWTRKTPYWY